MKQAGEGCIELRFEEALADNITVIIYGTFRGIVEISGSCEVSETLIVIHYGNTPGSWT